MGADGTDRRVVAAVGAIALVAVLARFLAVGERVAHWDEARVGYWILEFARTGSYEYRPIIHGPFLQHANRAVFAVFGVSDATMRYVPALVGGLLPLVALLFRAHLSDGETVALAGFLAANPVLLYYSRFMRGDPLVGAFMFGAFALFLRTLDTWQPRYLLAGTGVTALGVTVKENAPVYVLCWLGAAALVAWLRLLAARTKRERWLPDARTVRGRAGAADGRRVAGTAVAALALFLAVVVFFYAPRGDGGATLGAALADPTRFPAVVREATVGSYAEFHRVWGSGAKADHAYLPYFGHLLGTLIYGASVLCLFALVGFLRESYRGGGPRGVVIGCFAWGVASLLGYPIITDIKAPWAAVHVVLPLAVPAAVGLAATVRGGRAASAADRESLAVGGALVLAFAAISAGFVGYWGYHTSYANPQAPDNELVQYAQPPGEVRPVVERMDRAIQAEDGGTDVLLYGSFLVDGQPIGDRRAACAGVDGWFNSLPFPWYFERSDAAVACSPDIQDFESRESYPPVVIYAAAGSPDDPTFAEVRARLADRLEGYEAHTVRIRTTDTPAVVFVDRAAPNGTNERSRDAAASGAVPAPSAPVDRPTGVARSGKY